MCDAHRGSTWLPSGKRVGLSDNFSNIRQDSVKAKSSTHATGRAFDIRTRHFDDETVFEMGQYFNTYYRNIAAISYSTQKPHCAVVKKDHIHFQVKP